MVSALEIAEGSIALLEKAAQEADAFEAEVRVLRAENQQLKAQNSHLSKQAATKLDRSLLLKVASILEQEGLLADDMTADKLASLYEEDPNRLTDITLRLLSPAYSEGQPIGKAAATSQVTTKTVRFNGQDFVDNEGWLNVLK